MLKFDQNTQTHNLKSPAYSYRKLGYSIIPVHSNKVPAVPWKRYQSSHVAFSTQRNWWKRKDVKGIGIVTGAISHLAVLDFDNLQHFFEFAEQFPQLSQTFTVKTRRGFHYYFRIPSHLTTTSIKADGMDWLWEGRYVVAPPSTIKGVRYQITEDRYPKMITAQQLLDIENFVRQRTAGYTEQQTQTAIEKLSPESLIAHYRNQRKHGRNNALFDAGRLARDAGFPQMVAEDALLMLYANDQTTSHESSHRRLAEGRRTLASVYSRAPQTNPYRPIIHETNGLPNDVREKLADEGLLSLVRVWEALVVTNASDYLTENTIKDSLVVSPYAIRQALMSTINGKRVFQRCKKLPKRLSKLCNLDTRTKSKKIRSGRKTYYYRIPTIRDFCRMLNIKPKYPSDPIHIEDLQSAKGTRMAMHREFIRRCPGQYPRRWLAKRLGISVRTLQRYNRGSPDIQVIPMYTDVPLTWQMVNWLPDEVIGGTCLVDEYDRRYPPIPQLARRLLAQGHTLRYRRRYVNYYYFGTYVEIDELIC